VSVETGDSDFPTVQTSKQDPSGRENTRRKESQEGAAGRNKEKTERAKVFTTQGVIPGAE